MSEPASAAAALAGPGKGILAAMQHALCLWPLTFAFGRGLTGPALAAWRGEPGLCRPASARWRGGCR